SAAPPGPYRSGTTLVTRTPLACKTARAGGPTMAHHALTRELYQAICAAPLLDPHSHIDPFAPTAKSLDDILGYHYYTELAHSAGMDQKPLAKDFPPRERIRTILKHLSSVDNTVQYSWFLEIAQSFLGFPKDRV